MRAAFCTTSGNFELRELPQPEAGQVLVRVRVRSYGICGSDLHWYHGSFPPLPVCPGHEIAGDVAASPSTCRYGPGRGSHARGRTGPRGRQRSGRFQDGR